MSKSQVEARSMTWTTDILLHRNVLEYPLQSRPHNGMARYMGKTSWALMCTCCQGQGQTPWTQDRPRTAEKPQLDASVDRGNVLEETAFQARSKETLLWWQRKESHIAQSCRTCDRMQIWYEGLENPWMRFIKEQGKGQPGWMTRQANDKLPMRDCPFLRRAVHLWKNQREAWRASNLSIGRRAYIMDASTSIPCMGTTHSLVLEEFLGIPMKRAIHRKCSNCRWQFNELSGPMKMKSSKICDINKKL